MTGKPYNEPCKEILSLYGGFCQGAVEGCVTKTKSMLTSTYLLKAPSTKPIFTCIINSNYGVDTIDDTTTDTGVIWYFMQP